MQLPAPSIFRGFSSSQTETLNPQLTPCAHPPANHHSPFCLWIWLFWVPYASGIFQYLTFCVWLISLSMLSSRFIRAVHVSEFPCLRMNNTLLCVYTPHVVFPFIYQLALRVASTFWRLWTLLLWTQVYKHLFKTLPSVLLGASPEVELPGHAVILCFIFFLRNCHTSCIAAAPF